MSANSNSAPWWGDVPSIARRTACRNRKSLHRDNPLADRRTYVHRQTFHVIGRSGALWISRERMPA